MQKYQLHFPFIIKYLFVDVIESMNDYMDDGYELLFILSKAKGLSQGIERAKEIAGKCTYTPFLRLVPLIVFPLLETLNAIESDESFKNHDENENIATSWILVGLLRVHLLVPSLPLDPGRKPVAKVAQWNEYILDLRLKLTVFMLESRFTTGKNIPIAYGASDLLEETERAFKKQHAQSKKTVQMMQLGHILVSFKDLANMPMKSLYDLLRLRLNLLQTRFRFLIVSCSVKI